MSLKIIRNDITKVSADIIVNTANPMPTYASGTDRAVYEAAGVEELLKERKKIGEIAIGDIAVTPGFNLDAKYIIHTVGPVWLGGNQGEFDNLKSCYQKSLEMAIDLNASSIAFPLIATGVYHFPKDKALSIAISTINEFLMQHDMTVYLVVFDRRSFELSGKIFDGIDSYIDDHFVSNRRTHEYSRDLETGYRGSIERICSNRLQEEIPEETSVLCSDIGSIADMDLDDVINTEEKTFQERLLELIDNSGLTDPEVYKKANIDRKLFSKIRCDRDYKPKKKTAVALAIALELSYEDMTDLLARAGIALSPSSRFDIIIQYFVMKKIYDVSDINLALFKHGQQTLGE